MVKMGHKIEPAGDSGAPATDDPTKKKLSDSTVPKVGERPDVAKAKNPDDVDYKDAHGHKKSAHLDRDSNGSGSMKFGEKGPGSIYEASRALAAARHPGEKVSEGEVARTAAALEKHNATEIAKHGGTRHLPDDFQVQIPKELMPKPVVHHMEITDDKKTKPEGKKEDKKEAKDDKKEPDAAKKAEEERAAKELKDEVARKSGTSQREAEEAKKVQEARAAKELQDEIARKSGTSTRETDEAKKAQEAEAKKNKDLGYPDKITRDPAGKVSGFTEAGQDWFRGEDGKFRPTTSPEFPNPRSEVKEKDGVLTYKQNRHGEGSTESEVKVNKNTGAREETYTDTNTTPDTKHTETYDQKAHKKTHVETNNITGSELRKSVTHNEGQKNAWTEETKDDVRTVTLKPGGTGDTFAFQHAKDNAGKDVITATRNGRPVTGVDSIEEIAPGRYSIKKSATGIDDKDEVKVIEADRSIW